jgi:pyruvate/2-oxoglutarate dehydrogenase complex dihydrolipoamide dehydrogenase (E3) component
MCAIGRNADTEKLGVKEIGVKMHPSGKILVNEDYSTNIKNIFALGDVFYWQE